MENGVDQKEEEIHIEERGVKKNLRVCVEFEEGYWCTCSYQVELPNWLIKSIKRERAWVILG